MTAVDILFEAYDLLSEAEEREFIKRIVGRANTQTITLAIEDACTHDQLKEIVAWLLFNGDVKEVGELEAIYDVREARREKKRKAEERAARIKANAKRMADKAKHSPYSWDKEGGKSCLNPK